jgi:hypothetical protein
LFFERNELCGQDFITAQRKKLSVIVIVQQKTSKRHKETGFPVLCVFFSFRSGVVTIFLNMFFLAHICWAQNPDEQSFIILKSKEKIYGDVELKSPLFGQEYLLFNDTIQYTLSQLHAFQNKDGYFSVIHGGGIYGTLKLVKRTQSGKVSLYTAYQVYSSPGSYNTIATPGGRITQYNPGVATFARVDYFSKDTSDIMIASRDNLMAALSDNPKSIQLLREHKTLGTVKVLLVLGGLGLIGSAFIGADKDHPPSVGLLIAGGVVANLSWIPSLMQSDKIEKAIEVYNKK